MGRSDNQGLDWFLPAESPELHWIDCSGFFNGTHGLTAYRDHIRYTTDGGDSWASSFLDPALRVWSAALPAADRYFLASSRQSGGGELLRSTDSGETWAEVGGGLPNGSLAVGTVEFASSTVGFLHGRVVIQGRLYKTTDGGDSWTWLTTTGLPATVREMHWMSENTGVVTSSASGDWGIYRTTDGGSNWTQVSATRSAHLSFSSPLRGAASRFYTAGFLRTEDGGQTWVEENVPFYGSAQGVGTHYVNAVHALENAWLIGGSGNRILVGAPPEDPATDDHPWETAEVVPEVCRFVGVAPHPAQVSTRLEYQLEAPGEVRVTLHDVEGRRVRLLAQGEFSAGVHHLTWEGKDDRGNDLANGVYLARIIGLGTFDSMKVLLAR